MFLQKNSLITPYVSSQINLNQLLFIINLIIQYCPKQNSFIFFFINIFKNDYQLQECCADNENFYWSTKIVNINFQQYHMQRYGWQARANRLKASSQASQGESTSQNLNKNQNLTLQSFSNVKPNNNVPKTQRVNSYNLQKDNLNLTTERSGRITKISSISQNTLFQDMDFVPPRNTKKNTTKDEKLQNYKKQPIIQSEQVQHQRKNQPYSVKNKSLYNKAASASQRLNTNFTQLKSNVSNAKNIQPHFKNQSKSFEQPQSIQRLKIQQKNSTTALQLSKQSKTQRPQKLDESYNQRNNAEQKTNSSQRIRQPQNKTGDFFNDLIGNNIRTTRQRKKDQEVIKSAVQYKSISQQNKTQKISNKNNFEDFQKVREIQKGSQNKHGSPSTIPITLSQNFKSGEQTKLTKKQSNSLSSVSPIINKSVQISPLKVPSEFQFQIRIPSKLVIYSMHNIYINKLTQIFIKIDGLNKKKSSQAKKILNYHIYQLNRIFNNKKLQLYDSFLNRFQKIYLNQLINKQKRIKHPNQKRDINKQMLQKNINMIFIILKGIFKNKVKGAFVTLNKYHNKNKAITQPLINLVELYYKKLKIESMLKLKQTNLQQQLMTKSKLICFYIQKIFQTKIRKSFNKLKQHQINAKLKRDESKISIYVPYSAQSPIRKFQQHDRANSNIEHLAFSDSKMVNEEEQTVESHPIRKTAMAQVGDIKLMKLQKQLKQLSKQFQKQTTNIQFRVQQMKQMISEYNFQLQYKNAKQIQLQNYLNNAPKQETNIDKSRQSINEFVRLPNLSQFYFYIMKTPQNQIDISMLHNILIGSQNQIDGDHEIIIESWRVLLQNCKLKQILQKYEANEDQKRLNNYVLFAKSQHLTIKELLSNYIKQKYYWENVKSNLEQINANAEYNK